MSEDKQLSAIQVNTVLYKPSSKDVRDNLESLKHTIYQNIKKKFPTLPDSSKEKTMHEDIWKYIKNYPQSLIFIPKKELHLLPVVIEQYKRFSNEFTNSKSNHAYLDVIEKHEMEHVRALWELDDSDFDGIGIITFRRGSLPVFCGYVGYEDKWSKVGKLKSALASTSHYEGDVDYAIKSLTQNTSVKELMSDLTDKETLYILGTQLIPKAAKVYSQRAINKIKDSPLKKLKKFY